ncbi:hypothetical protein AVEN_251608-1 [Araneus ventricosus]|uniref:Uncharacterized protein n=1 Tax=Araneus ventricosus TaxID=182803 RepID=A0A4Y2EWF2_ARAVE|nr:hypothetical protein AVEN_251608-1 [Araneus ventricosus]
MNSQARAILRQIGETQGEQGGQRESIKKWASSTPNPNIVRLSSKMRYLVLVLVAFCVGSIRGENVRMETVFAVTACRSACLDEYTDLVKTEKNCKDDRNCTMCWETCEMMHQNLKLWGSLCSVPEICLPGCQTACKMSTNNSLNENDALIPFSLTTKFDRDTMRYTLHWIPQRLPESRRTILYTVLFKDKGEDWQIITQTVNYAVEIKGNLMGRTTAIRILAANVTHQIAFTETNFVNSLVTEKKVYLGDENWSPQLVSMVRSDTSTGILTTITWPGIPEEFGPNEYEVSWNAVGDPMEVTGHLQTSENKAVLTLWPDSIYLVTVDRYTSDGIIYGDATQALIINTKKSISPHLGNGSSTFCNIDDRFHISNSVYVMVFVVVSVSMMIMYYIIGKVQREVREEDRKKALQASLIFDKLRHMLLKQEPVNGKPCLSSTRNSSKKELILSV